MENRACDASLERFVNQRYEGVGDGLAGKVQPLSSGLPRPHSPIVPDNVVESLHRAGDLCDVARGQRRSRRRSERSGGRACDEELLFVSASTGLRRFVAVESRKLELRKEGG